MKLFGLPLRSITLHYSFIAVAIISPLIYLLRGKAMFVVTGTRNGAEMQSQVKGVIQGLLQWLNADSPPVMAIDILSGLILGYVGVASGSLILVSVAAILLVSPLVKRFGWDNQAIQALVYLPPVLVLAGLATGLSGVTGTQSQYLALTVCSILLF